MEPICQTDEGEEEEPLGRGMTCPEFVIHSVSTSVVPTSFSLSTDTRHPSLGSVCADLMTACIASKHGVFRQKLEPGMLMMLLFGMGQVYHL